MLVVWQSMALALVIATGVRADNDTLSDTCEPGLWGGLLEEWALTAPVDGARHGRVMSLPPTKDYYVSDRIDLVPPPAPHHHGPHYNGVPHGGPHAPPHGTQPNIIQQGPSQGLPTNKIQRGSTQCLYSSSVPYGPMSGPPDFVAHPTENPGLKLFIERLTTPPTPRTTPKSLQVPPGCAKIVNKPPNPYKDQFRPSYAPPSPNQPIPLPQQQWGAADRLDAPPSTPQKLVSETDLYLLSAIEKLVYRVDLMEKRLRKMEETMHYLVVGKETKPEPCAANFTRVGTECYYFSPDAGDWKAASLRCRKMRTHLLELDSDDEKRVLFSALLADKRYKGMDFWTGGLNPGLLWIWAHSARPVLHNATVSNSSAAAAAVPGDGRCLAAVHDASLARYVYRGQDCSLRHHFICELPQDKAKEKLSNDIERASRQLRGAAAAAARQARLVPRADVHD